MMSFFSDKMRSKKDTWKWPDFFAFCTTLVKNDVSLLVPIGKVLELGFPECFFIKA